MQPQDEQRRLPIFESLANGIPVPQVQDLQFEFDTPSACASAFETEEMRRTTLVNRIMELMTLLNVNENMLVLHLNDSSRGILDKLFNKHVKDAIFLREIVTTLYFDKLDDIGRKMLFDKHGIRVNRHGRLVVGGKRMKRMTKSKSKSKSKSKKRI